MSWLKDLYNTYQDNLDYIGKYDEHGRNPLLPACHLLTKTVICVTIDENSNFIRADFDFLSDTISACSEQSMARSGKLPKAHALSDEIIYLDENFYKYVSLPECLNEAGCVDVLCKNCKSNDNFKKRYISYVEQLQAWTAFDSSHHYHSILLGYIEKHTLTADLIKAKALKLDPSGKIRVAPLKEEKEDPSFKELRKSKITPRTIGKIGVRWKIQINDEIIKTWENRVLHDSWIGYVLKGSSNTDLCLISGGYNVSSSQSMKYIRHSGDSTLLISGNDDENFTYKGKFQKGKTSQVMSLGLRENQEAHASLKWLLTRQGFKESGKGATFALVAWGKEKPGNYKLLEDDFFPDENETLINTQESIGRNIALRLKGMAAQVSHANSGKVIILALNSPSSSLKGRSSIIHYSQYSDSEYYLLLEYWHSNAAWKHRFLVENPFEGAPSPARIAQACFERNVGNKWEVDSEVLKRTIRDFLPCIVQRQPIPKHYLITITNKVSKRHSYKREHANLWERNLEVACSLVRHNEIQKNNINYNMELELENKNRDYLYGCLLAIADHFEDRVLKKQASSGHPTKESGENEKITKERNASLNKRRPTNAARMMSAFSQKPYNTWANLHKSIEPYLLKQQQEKYFFQEAVGDVMKHFKDGEYEKNTPLEGVYLLGFYAQREALKSKK